jgi:hypothetical protein
MGETDYGKCGNVSVKWEFSKIHDLNLKPTFLIIQL